MLSLALVILVTQADIQPRNVKTGKLPSVANSPVATRVNEAVFFNFETQTEGESEQDFVVVRNDARILVLTVTGETCGAYCETYSRDLVFDMASGRMISADELVTAKGLKTMRAALVAERKRRYRAEAKTNKAALGKTKASDKDAREDLEARIALNEGCEQENEVYDVRYSIGKTDSVVMTASRCSNHAMRALDDVGDVSVDFPAAKLDLTPYGKALLAGGPDVPPPPSPFGQVLHGAVGKSPVTMLLDTPNKDGSVRGQYFYDKHRKAIEIYGKVEGATATIEEDGGKMTLNVRQSILVGTWSGNGKELPVTLKP